jgi:hypothetical protein
MTPAPDHPSHPSTPPADDRPASVFALILARPAVLAEARLSRRAPWLLLAAGLAGCALYGALAGFFAGGVQIAVAALKVPLIVALALALCLPSFAVFHLLAGGELGAGGLVRAASGFVATVGLLLAALGPLAWLFSISSRWLATAVLCHLVAFGVALGFALRFLRAMAGGGAPRAAAVVWSLLFWLTAVQLAAYLGPVLVAEPAGELFPLDRGSFLGRFGEILDYDPVE